MTEGNAVQYPDIKILDETDLWISVSILDVEITFAKDGYILRSSNVLALHQDPEKYGLTKKNKKLQDLLDAYEKRVAGRLAVLNAVNKAFEES